MNVSRRDFTEQKNNAYVANDYSGNIDDFISRLDESTRYMLSSRYELFRR